MVEDLKVADARDKIPPYFVPEHIREREKKFSFYERDIEKWVIIRSATVRDVYNLDVLLKRAIDVYGVWFFFWCRSISVTVNVIKVGV